MLTDYYQKKLMQWQYNPAYRDYSDYVIRNKSKLAKEFEEDRDTGFSEVCDFLHEYEENQVKNAAEAILSESFNLDKDVLNILVSATLEACGLKNEASDLLKLAVVGLIGFGMVAILASIFSKK